MSANNPMIQGLADSLLEDNEGKFAREKSFGKKLLATAWAVEIMAALLGLLIAFFMAFDAYNATDEKGFSVGLNALLGALPFLLIAVIEPTKIPLAGGLYKIKHWGWKILIFFALAGLTLVTFETIFTGLERQVTNVTERISLGENEIRNLQERNKENLRQISDYQKLNIVDETKDLEAKIVLNRASRDEAIKAELANRKQQIDQLNLEIDNEKNSIKKIELERENDRNANVSVLNVNFERLNNQIKTYTIEKQSKNDKLIQLGQINIPDAIVSDFEKQISDLNDKIEVTTNYITSNEIEQIKKAQNIIGVLDDGKKGPNTNRNFEIWRVQQESKISNFTSEIIKRKKINEARSSKNNKILSDEINNISSKITDLEFKRDSLEQEIQNINITQNSIQYDNTKIEKLQESISSIRKRIKILNVSLK